MTIKMIDKWVTSLRFNEIKSEKKKKFMLVFKHFIFCRLAETAVLVLHKSHDFLRNDVSLGS